MSMPVILKSQFSTSLGNRNEVLVPICDNWACYTLLSNLTDKIENMTKNIGSYGEVVNSLNYRIRKHCYAQNFNEIKTRSYFTTGA